MRSVTRGAAAAATSLLLVGCGAGAGGDAGSSRPGRAPSTIAPRPAAAPAKRAPGRTSVVVRKRTLTFVDRRRRLHRRDGRVVARRLVTVVRYPKVVGRRGSRALRERPLIVFAHGYALTPKRYRRLLRAWAQAGYVVAAPTLPGESADAPGGPNRADLVNEPADLRFVIARLLAVSARPEGPLRGAIDRSSVVVAGHSDGGDSALTVAYDAGARSRRVDAAIVLAGADLPGAPPLRFPDHGPPLLAVQGGADRVNVPAATRAFYRRAGRPKLLLTFPGAGHLGPFTGDRPQLTVLERMTVAFLDRVTKGDPTSWERVVRLGRRPGVSRVRADVSG